MAIFPEVELLGHKAVSFLTFWGISMLLSTWADQRICLFKGPRGGARTVYMRGRLHEAPDRRTGQSEGETRWREAGRFGVWFGLVLRGRGYGFRRGNG